VACILIIDDDDQIRKTLRATLERDGHNVVEAPDGHEGIRLFQRNGADLVIRFTDSRHVAGGPFAVPSFLRFEVFDIQNRPFPLFLGS